MSQPMSQNNHVEIWERLQAMDDALVRAFSDILKEIDDVRKRLDNLEQEEVSER